MKIASVGWEKGSLREFKWEMPDKKVNQMNRRDFISSLVVSTTVGALSSSRFASAFVLEDGFPSVRTITGGPKHHWFGYYDKLQFDSTNRFVLSNQVDFEHRTPTPDDVIQVGMVDTAREDKWIELGESRSWGWQQGCMLQWVPGTKDQVIWNDRVGDRFVSHICNVATKKKRTLASPVYTLAPNGQFGLAADFARIQIMRPGYGYVGLDDAFHDEAAPQDSGVFRVDLKTGDKQLILSLAEVAKIPYQGKPLTNVKHYFNHVLVSPDSRRFIVLHRWRPLPQSSGGRRETFVTRMITANVDGSDVFVLDPSGRTSHFIWKNAENVCMWTKPEGKPTAFYLFEDKTRNVQVVGKGVMTRNGHNTYLPVVDSNWILNDTYPDKNRNQKPYLYHVPSGKQFVLGEFELPKIYKGEWRCDTHPRSSNDGRLVCIDSPHEGEGRQLHLIDVGAILDRIGV